jgi:Xaa-Pro aminopeptidase
MTETLSNIYADRCQRAQTQMVAAGIDYLFVGPGSDLRYLIGTKGMDNERMMVLVIPQKGDPTMVVPRLEKLATSKYATFFEMLDWTDDEGPQKRLQQILGDATQREIKAAVNPHLWSMFLIRLQELMPKTTWATADAVLKKLRITKTAEELKLLREAAGVADQTFKELVNLRFEGRAERDIMSDINGLLLKYGQEEMLFCIVGSGPNGAQPHHHTGDRIIQKGEPVVLDFGGSYHGYCSDMTRMVIVGEQASDSEYEKVHNTVYAAVKSATAHVKPGVTCESVDAQARNVITEAGYGEYFVHRTGHGIGMEVHEDPYIVSGNQTLLEPGMAFSIEPGIYLPQRFGVRIEDIVVVTETGGENINLSTHEVVHVK